MSEARGGTAWLLVGAAILVGVGLVVAGRGGPTVDHTEQIALWRGEDPGCPTALTAEHVDRGIALAGAWLVGARDPRGTFVDGRDPRTGAPDEQLDLPRQAVAAWSLARLATAPGTPPDLAASAREASLGALAFWRSAASPAGVPLVPGTDRAPASGLAILALAAAELAADPGLAPADRDAARAQRDALLTHVVAAFTPSGRVTDEILGNGKPHGEPTASADAASLAALVRAGRDDRPDLAEPALALARATWAHDVDKPRKKRRDPPATQDVFPWAGLALRDLAASGWLDTEDAGPNLGELAVWMIDDHQTLRRSGNTGYAASAIAASAGWAASAEDDRAPKLRCVSDRMVARLLSLQVGHPLASDAAAGVPPSPQVTGALVAGATDPRIRVDYAAYVLVALLEWRGSR